MNRQKTHINNRFKDAIICLLTLAFVFGFPPSSTTAQASTITEIDDRTQATSNSASPPTWEPPLDSTYTQNAPVVYASGNEIIQGRFPSCETCPPESTSHRKPDLPPDSPQPPHKWPYAPSVKILAQWPSGESTACSGMLIQPNYALTAAHCVFTHKPERCVHGDACWVDHLIIYTHYGDILQEETTNKEILTWTAWTVNRDYNYDLAVVELTDHIGEEIRGVGWLGFGFNNDSDNAFFSNAQFVHASFPVTVPNNSNELKIWKGQIRIPDHQSHLFRSSGASYQGQCGAALHSPDANHVIYGVLSHLVEDGTETGYTRITYDKFFAIRDWITGGIKAQNFYHYIPLIHR